MIDTGAEVNLLKKNCIKPSTKIDKTDLLQLTGITFEKQNTLEGYMPLLQLSAGIYASEALIKNSNDFREDTLLNSGPYTSNKTNAPDSSEILSFIHTIFTEKNGEECPKLNTLDAKPSFTSSRAESVRALLRLNHLNLEEARSVSKLIKDNADIFHLPGEPLGCADILRHKILPITFLCIQNSTDFHLSTKRKSHVKHLNY
ncbi:hypothetical protein M0804_015364 [Polistes exclamans]|nr:hypothetical protein M0804_015364 [Polistes exclamans]